MNKAELVAAIADWLQTPKKDTERMVNAFIQVVQSTLKAGDKIRLDGLGVFNVVTRAARTGRNPQTGAPVDVAEKRAVTFKPGKELKQIVNE